MSVVYINKSNPESEVIKNDNIVLVYFYAPWCRPCKILEPEIDNLADTYARKENVVIAKVDIDEYQEFALEKGVKSVPTVMIFKNKEVIDISIGVTGKDYYEDKINSAI